MIFIFFSQLSSIYKKIRCEKRSQNFYSTNFFGLTHSCEKIFKIYMIITDHTNFKCIYIYIYTMI